MPRSAREMKNPLPLTPELLTEARAHFADHCALCHGNDGRGQTQIGRNLYPKSPDMTLADTQSHLAVKTKDGKVVNVPFAKTTRFYLGKKKAGAGDVQVGQKVVVHLGADGAAEQVKLPASKAKGGKE
jgi:hypothetical protein